MDMGAIERRMGWSFSPDLLVALRKRQNPPKRVLNDRYRD